MEIEFGKVGDLNGQPTSRRMRDSHAVGFLQASLLGEEWRFEFARVGTDVLPP